MIQPLATRDAGAVAALRAEVGRLDDGLAALRARIALERPDPGAVTGADALSLADIRSRLGPDAALMVIDAPRFSTDPGLIVAVSDTSVDWHSFQVPGTEVEAAIRDLPASINLRLGVRSAVPIGVASAPPPPFDLVASHWLYTQLVVQVSTVTAGKRDLCFDLRGEASALPPHLMMVMPPRSDDPRRAD